MVARKRSYWGDLDKVKEYQNREDVKLRRIERDFKRKYNLTLEAYAALLEKQQGKCALCLREQTERLHVDHNHSTGEVRGLLCERCNRALGLFADSPALLASAVRYLEERGSYGSP